MVQVGFAAPVHTNVNVVVLEAIKNWRCRKPRNETALSPYHIICSIKVGFYLKYGLNYIEVLFLFC